MEQWKRINRPVQSFPNRIAVMQRSPFFFLLATLAGACACTPDSDRGESGSSAAVAVQERFPSDTYIRGLLEEIVRDPRTTGAVVGLVEPDGTQRVNVYGSSGSERNPLDTESVFEIGSITKVFTGVLLADMVRRGEVELTEPLARLLPSSVRVPSRNGQEITVLDLATHTSGLPNMPANFPRGNEATATANYTIEQMYDFLSGYELSGDPGETYQYSNLGLSLLGHALALRGGKPYENLLHERVLVPLHMDNTAISPTEEMEGHLTSGHTELGDPAPFFVGPAFEPSGGLKSTVGDMLKFAVANLFDGETPIQAALRESRQPRRPGAGARPFNGLGWGVVGTKVGVEGTVVGHEGRTFGYGSFIHIDLERRRAVVVLLNNAGAPVEPRDPTLLTVHLADPTKFPRPIRRSSLRP